MPARAGATGAPGRGRARRRLAARAVAGVLGAACSGAEAGIFIPTAQARWIEAHAGASQDRIDAPDDAPFDTLVTVSAPHASADASQFSVVDPNWLYGRFSGTASSTGEDAYSTSTYAVDFDTSDALPLTVDATCPSGTFSVRLVDRTRQVVLVDATVWVFTPVRMIFPNYPAGSFTFTASFTEHFASQSSGSVSGQFVLTPAPGWTGLGLVAAVSAARRRRAD